MSARQTTTMRVTVTRVRTPKSAATKTSKGSSDKKGNSSRCSKCGRFL